MSSDLDDEHHETGSFATTNNRHSWIGWESEKMEVGGIGIACFHNSLTHIKLHRKPLIQRQLGSFV
jgi:hypothetical protein